MVEDAEPARDDLLSLNSTTPSFYTGYAYFGGVDAAAAASSTTGRILSTLGLRVEVLRPGRAASRRNPAAGVLWADDVHWTASGGARGRTRTRWRGRPRSHVAHARQRKGLAGQHRAYSDGRVEWVPAAEVGLDDQPDQRTSNASLRIEPLYYYWF